jgi:hypothetical protein
MIGRMSRTLAGGADGAVMRAPFHMNPAVAEGRAAADSRLGIPTPRGFIALVAAVLPALGANQAARPTRPACLPRSR